MDVDSQPDRPAGPECDAARRVGVQQHRDAGWRVGRRDATADLSGWIAGQPHRKVSARKDLVERQDHAARFDSFAGTKGALDEVAA